MTRADLGRMFGLDPSRGPLPQSPEAALLLANVFQRLGGSFHVGGNGRRYYGMPEPVSFRLAGQELPQMPYAEPWEQFHDPQEWRGALKLLHVLLARLGEADAAYVFDLFAPIAVDERKLSPSIEEPKRRAA